MKKVSIVMPTFNGANWIKRAIDSIKAQSYTDWELLVIDDGSTDDTASVVRSAAAEDDRIRYIKNDQNMGIQKTLNRGLKEAEGVYIARLDDDDIWCDTEKLARQVEFLDKNPEYSLVGTSVILIDEKGNEISKSNREPNDLNIRKIILSNNPFAHSSVVFVRDEIISIGGYSESGIFKHIEDYELWLRVGSSHRFANLQIYGAKISVHRESISFVNRVDQYKKTFKLINLYKNSYPNYLKAVFRNFLLLCVYQLLNVSLIKRAYFPLYKIYKNI